VDIPVICLIIFRTRSMGLAKPASLDIGGSSGEFTVDQKLFADFILPAMASELVGVIEEVLGGWAPATA
jgi:hypothetical protein